MSTRLGFLRAALLALPLLIATTAGAAPVTITMTGVLDTVDDPLTGTFAVGQAFTINYTFESTTAPRDGSTSNGAVYDALSTFDFTVGGFTGTSTGPQEIQIDNDLVFPDHDRYAVVTGASDIITAPPVGAFDLAWFFVRLDDTTNSAISDALILPTSLDVNDFDSTTFFASFSNDAGDALITGHITSIVPEPSSIVLGGFGLLGLGLAAWRRRAV